MTSPSEASAEAVVVGMSLNDSRCLERCLELGVAPLMFDDERLMRVFAAMVAADGRRESPDAVRLSLELPELAVLLADVMAVAPAAQAVDHYAHEVIAASWARRVARELAELSQAAYQRKHFEPLAPLKTRIDAVLRGLQDVRDTGGPVPIAAVMARCVENLEARITKSAPAGISTGLKTLDAAFAGGWQPARLYFPAARPGRGKTTFAINAMDAASAAGKRVAFFTIEMPCDQIAEKHVSLGSMVRGPKLVTGDLSQDEGDRVMGAIGLIAERQIWIDDSSAGDVQEIIRRCRRLHRAGSLDLVFIDYLQLLHANGRWASRVAELTYITGALKHMALETKVPVVCLATINREAEKYDSPGIHHLKDSGSIEQDGDAVMLIHRDREDRTWMNVAKNRNGPEGIFEIQVEPQISRVRDADGRMPEAFRA